jgi:hypothetical protein
MVNTEIVNPSQSNHAGDYFSFNTAYTDWETDPLDYFCLNTFKQILTSYKWLICNGANNINMVYNSDCDYISVTIKCRKYPYYLNVLTIRYVIKLFWTLII